MKRLYGLYAQGRNDSEPKRLRVLEAYPACQTIQHFGHELANAQFDKRSVVIRPLSNEEVRVHRLLKSMGLVVSEA